MAGLAACRQARAAWEQKRQKAKLAEQAERTRRTKLLNAAQAKVATAAAGTKRARAALDEVALKQEATVKRACLRNAVRCVGRAHCVWGCPASACCERR